jgi:hypothetical protein
MFELKQKLMNTKAYINQGKEKDNDDSCSPKPSRSIERLPKSAVKESMKFTNMKSDLAKLTKDFNNDNLLTSIIKKNMNK